MNKKARPKITVTGNGVASIKAEDLIGIPKVVDQATKILDNKDKIINKKEKNMSQLRTSEEWNQKADYVVLDPDGWDRSDWHYSWFTEKITLDEFNRRICNSTILRG